MALMSPQDPRTLQERTFSIVSDSPWPSSGFDSVNLPNNVSTLEHRQSTAPFPIQHTGDPASATTPQDITAPSPSTSDTSTVFTDLDAEEVSEREVEEQKEDKSQSDPSRPVLANSPQTSLKIDTINSSLKFRPADEDDGPQSVIHVPSTFGRFHRALSNTPKPPSRLSQSTSISRPESALSSTASTASTIESNSTVTANTETTIVTSSGTNTTTTDSESTVQEARNHTPIPAKLDLSQSFYNAQMPPGLLQTQIPIPAVPDWTSTPRAQTRQDLANFNISRPGSSLASISELDGPEQSDVEGPIGVLQNDRHRRRSSRLSSNPVDEIEALKSALSECWTFCNTLANLSQMHRERIFSNHSGKGDMQEQAWKSCWKLCQNLYATRDTAILTTTRQTLDLCRDFCQSLFEVRSRNNETADSVLRVSFELNNHLFNTHDRTLPEAFRERTLDFYVTLCHRLMKQKSKMTEATDSLLKACWSLAEMLFSLRQGKRENRRPDGELLGSAIQACWELCDLFREGWTQIRPEKSTPRATQTTFSQAFHQAKKAGLVEELGNLKLSPETPTTIFEDTATISPEEPVLPTISVMQSTRHQLQGIPQSAVSTASAPPAFPRPNTGTQRISRDPPQRQSRWSSINAIMSEDEGMTSGPDPASAISSVSQSSYASSRISKASSASVHTLRTPAEDPSLTLLKACFVRAATQTGRGFQVDPRSANGRDTTNTSLPLFAKTLPENAFGNAAWQRTLLDNFKRTVTSDPTFRSLGAAVATIGLGTDPEKGKEEIAATVMGMVSNTYGWAWLKDLYRYGYGMYLEDVLGGKNGNIPPPAPTEERSAKPRSGSNDSKKSRYSSNDSGNVNTTSSGNEGRKRNGS